MTDVLSYWDYRVIEFPADVKWETDPYRMICEVHYDNHKPMGFVTNAVVMWEDADGDPHWILDKMHDALEKPVLLEKDFFTEKGENNDNL